MSSVPLLTRASKLAALAVSIGLVVVDTSALCALMDAEEGASQVENMLEAGRKGKSDATGGIQ